MNKHDVVELRRSIGTQVVVAKRLGLSKTSIKRYESQSYPTPTWYELALKELARSA